MIILNQASLEERENNEQKMCHVCNKSGKGGIGKYKINRKKKNRKSRDIFKRRKGLIGLLQLGFHPYRRLNMNY